MTGDATCRRPGRLDISNEAEQGEVRLPVIAARKLHPSLLVGDTVALEDTSGVIESMASYSTVAMSVINRF